MTEEQMKNKKRPQLEGRKCPTYSKLLYTARNYSERTHRWSPAESIPDFCCHGYSNEHVVKIMEQSQVD